jgi:hypothetical protein
LRKTGGVSRGEVFILSVDGRELLAHPGETLAAAMLAADARAFRKDRSGRPRGLFCNMGVCSECLVNLLGDDGVRRIRACVTSARPGMTVETGADA